MAGVNAKLLKDESRIVWLEPTDRLDYVREKRDDWFKFRQRPPRRGSYCGGRIIGYAVLKKDAKSPQWPSLFSRRVFWLATHDRDTQPNGVYQSGTPCEAVDPRTVKPRKPGVLTERAWGRPFTTVEGTP